MKFHTLKFNKNAQTMQTEQIQISIFECMKIHTMK